MKQNGRRSIRQGANGQEARLKIVPNDVECFSWRGTRQDAIDLQRGYLDVVNSMGINARSNAARAADYLMVIGLPKSVNRVSALSARCAVGNRGRGAAPRRCPWLALHEHVPDTGEEVEDIFVGKELAVLFTGDRKKF